MVFRSFLAAGVAVLGVLPCPEALAQTCTPGLYVAVTAPRDGEVGVPANTIIDVRVAGDPIPSGIENQFSLRDSLGGFITLSLPDSLPNAAPYIRAIRLKPALGNLNPGTYQVVRGGISLSMFTIDSPPDINNPLPPIGATATVDTFDLHPDGGSDCIRDRIRRVRLTV